FEPAGSPPHRAAPHTGVRKRPICAVSNVGANASHGSARVRAGGVDPRIAPCLRGGTSAGSNALRDRPTQFRIAEQRLEEKGFVQREHVRVARNHRLHQRGARTRTADHESSPHLPSRYCHLRKRTMGNTWLTGRSLFYTLFSQWAL